MYSYGSPHTAAQKQDDQHERTFSSYVRIQVVVLKTYLGRWTIGRSGERGSGISVLPEHDMMMMIYQTYTHTYIHLHTKRTISIYLSIYLAQSMHFYISINQSIYIYIYIYIYNGCLCVFVCVCVSINLSIYIYIYIYRKRETDILVLLDCAFHLRSSNNFFHTGDPPSNSTTKLIFFSR